MKKYFQIIHEDEDIVVVNKAPGVLSIPDRYKSQLPNIKDLLSKDNEEIFIVHRLDKDTSGIICFAKNAQAHAKLSKQFENRDVQKFYQAIVHGTPQNESDEINLSILIPDHTNKVSISTQGKASTSRYKVIEKFVSYSLLEVELITGRKHQIRAHLAHVKLPIVADGTYGLEDSWSLSSIKKKKYHLKKWENEKPLIYRQLLHAQRLQITHPSSDQQLELEAPYPKDFKAMLNQLRKLNSLTI